MRSVTELRNIIRQIELNAEVVTKDLYAELEQASQKEDAEAVAADEAAGRTNVHAKAHNPVFKFGKAHWETREEGRLHCSYCGSLSPAEAVKLLKTPGTSFSGSDWKYGWPHKFYIGGTKFYNEHLVDADEATFVEFSDLSAKIFGITWNKHPEKGLGYKSPKGGFYGYQRAGTIGQIGEPLHTL